METNPQLIKRLVENGGRVLVVGGNVDSWMPAHLLANPKITTWDDTRQGIDNREIPRSAKVIIYTNQTGHKTAARLKAAAASQDAICFPMKRAREVRELLSEFEPPPIVDTVAKPPVKEDPKPAAKTAPRGSVKEFINSNLRKETDWTVRGAATDEARRIYNLAQDAGIMTTERSVEQAVRTLVRESLRGKPVSKPPVAQEAKPEAVIVPTLPPTPIVAPATKKDDFTELVELIESAIVALKLVQDHMPKVQAELEKSRSGKQSIRQRLLAELAALEE